MSDTWRSPGPPGLPGPGEVHVWRLRLVPGPLDAGWSALLAADERERAARFLQVADRQRFEAGRGFLRFQLGRYLAGDPRAWRFEPGPFGKPELADAPRGACRFNVSHAGAIVLVAFAMGPVGVDVEGGRAIADPLALASSAFSPAEQRALAAYPAGEREGVFLRTWARKEAYMKARGLGFSLASERFTVGVAPDEPAHVLAATDEPNEAARWELRDLAPGPGYAGAIAHQQPLRGLACFEAPEGPGG